MKKITKKTFKGIKQQYSNDCWNEIIEELALSYAPHELQLIREWLTGMCWCTTFEDMKKKAQEQWKNSPDAEKLLFYFDDLMRDLYQSGIIGNYTKKRICENAKGENNLSYAYRFRWYFRGDEILLKNQGIMIHKIFHTVLSSIPPES